MYIVNNLRHDRSYKMISKAMYDRWRILLLSVSLIITSACQNDQPDQTAQREDTSTSESSVTIDDQLTAAATTLNIKASDAEGTVTALLRGLATAHKAQLRGLSHRLKTQSSTVRKLKKIYNKALSKGQDPTPNTLTISDALRYTMEVDDQPPGHYVKTVNTVLKSLEGKGFKVFKVKNSWPRGDNYSGVNVALITPKGLEWELQFHTPASYQEAKRSHVLYEQLRAEDTPLKKRQELFSTMSAPWDSIAVPQGVLTPHNLHEVEEIKQWDAPQ